jgi:nicotinamide-nucleotide amidase
VPVDVEIVLVGDEFALGLVPDPPSGEAARRLLGAGLEVAQVTAASSREWAVEAALRGALERADVVLAFGGLGTRPGDIVARVAAKVAGRRLVMHDSARLSVEAKLAKRKPRADGSPAVPPNVEKLVLLPQRAELVPNPRGMADGFRLLQGGKHLVCLPGAAADALAMLEAEVYPFLVRELAGRVPSRLAVLKCFGLPMARVEEALEGIGDAPAAAAGPSAQGRLLVEPFAVFPEIHVKVLASGAAGAPAGAVEERVEATVAELAARLGDACFGRDDDTLESVAGRLLAARGETVATAESCTGGMLGGRFTATPGSSAWYERGVVTYSNAAKTGLLGVPAALVQAHGAVSAEVAEAMASRVRSLAGTTWGLSITGIAGPGGGTPQKPVGTVFVGLAGPGGVEARAHRFGGGRREIRLVSAEVALDWLRRALVASG